MWPINLKIEPQLIERGVKALEKIAFCLEQYLLPRPRQQAGMKPKGPEALTEFNPEAEWLKEQEEDLRGKPP